MRKLLASLLIGCQWRPLPQTPQTAVLDVKNITCSMCSITVRKALEKVPGVIDARVDYDHKTATVKYDPEKASPAAFVKATANAGVPSMLHNGTQK
jgi:mercuric ion binding protein